MTEEERISYVQELWASVPDEVLPVLQAFVITLCDCGYSDTAEIMDMACRFILHCSSSLEPGFAEYRRNIQRELKGDPFQIVLVTAEAKLAQMAGSAPATETFFKN